jgi:two-component system phosphate regulon sensor histidine kinase PhoR
LRTYNEIHRSNLREQIIRNVSHDAKTPLTLLRLYGELLQEGDLTEEEKKSYCEIIVGETERLSGVVAQLLDFTQIEINRKLYRFEVQDLNPIVVETMRSYSEHLKTRGFQIETDFVPPIPPVLCDREAVIQAMRNLLDNARKYSKERKFIRVELSCKGNWVVLQIEDRGIGIKESAKKKIFKPFYRGDDNPYRKGDGLGLFLVKEIMKKHKGKIACLSAEGKGTCFQLRFPTAVKRFPAMLETVTQSLAANR